MTNTFDVNVGVSSNTTTHQFESAETGAIIRGTIRGGGEYAHSYVSAVTDGLEKKNSTITVNVGSTVAGKSYTQICFCYIWCCDCWW